MCVVTLIKEINSDIWFASNTFLFDITKNQIYFFLHKKLELILNAFTARVNENR